MYLVAIDLVLVAIITFRIFLRDAMLPSSRMAWFLVVLTLPFFGGALYFLFGEIDLGHKASAQQQRINDNIHKHAEKPMGNADELNDLVIPKFRASYVYASSINGFHAVGGNKAELQPDAQSARDRLIQDIDGATHSVHVQYYIWLTDKTGTDTANAIIRAARRGLTCRVIVDGLGSRSFVKSPLWTQMGDAGVQTAVALPLDNPIRTILTSRLDLRNHRKISVIDGKIAYCGSQNCADPEFRVKEKFGPWIDIVLRLQGPVVAQFQLLFASDWMKETDTPVADFPVETEFFTDGFTAQAIGHGPTVRVRATPQLLVTLIASAQSELTITTPYFVPDPTVIEALCAASYRHVKVTLLVPRNNDSRIVAAASKSYYKTLLEAGAQIYEFRDGLLHSKTMTIDRQAVYMGSSNIDIRSFDLNYENDVLIQDRVVTGAVQGRQQTYISGSDRVRLGDLASWTRRQKIWHNVIATIGPVL